MNKIKGFFTVAGFLFTVLLHGQTDTLHITKGFSNYHQAADSLIARLIASKPGNIEDFLLSKSLFIKGVRQRDTTTPENFITGTYFGYQARTRKSFKKLYKKIRNKPFYLKTAKRDSIYLYANTGDPSLHRVEVYFKRKKEHYYIKFQLWNINGTWYFYDKFLLEREQ